MSKQKLVVLSGAGMSAESGIETFRDNDGLWENHEVMEVASIDGWRKNPELVLEFYNQRRAQLKEVQPNEGHKALADLEDRFDITIVTQNVDNLHERAGSSNVVHLHGELNKVRSVTYEDVIYEWTGALKLGDLCERGTQLRPHIVWFGEMVPMLEHAILEVATADILMVVGTSMQVYPAASLVGYFDPSGKIYYVDPKPQVNYEMSRFGGLKIFPEIASVGIPRVIGDLLEW